MNIAPALSLIALVGCTTVEGPTRLHATLAGCDASGDAGVDASDASDASSDGDAGSLPLWVIWGASNAGFTGLDTDVDPEWSEFYPSVAYYCHFELGQTSDPWRYTDGWEVVHPLAPSMRWFGAEASLARELGAGAIIKVGKVATGVLEIQPGLANGNFERLTGHIATALATAPGDYHVAGIYIASGEKDANNEGWSSAFAANLANQLSSMQSTLGVTFPAVRVVRLMPGQAPTKPYYDVVRAVQETYDFIDADDLELKDTVHYTSQSQIELGLRILP